MHNDVIKIFTINSIQKTFFLFYSFVEERDYVEISEIVFDNEGNVIIKEIDKKLQKYVINYIREELSAS